MLRYCTTCLEVRQTASREMCRRCNGELLPLLDENGAISRSFLAARGSCCDTGCRNCPYENSEANDDAASSTQTKKCERCNASFECRSGNCWCDNVQLAPATLQWLGRNYVGCLCPACLEKFSTASA
jgi:hypothetical protein